MDADTQFTDLPRETRMEMVGRLKRDIEQRSHLYGGKFSSNLLFEENRPVEYCQYFTAYFPGTQEDVIWNAQIQTASRAFWDELLERARLIVEPLVKDEDAQRVKESLFDRLIPHETDESGKVLTYKIKPAYRYECLGGMTRIEKEEEVARRLVQTEPPIIHESFRIVHGYEYGIGVEMTVDEELIDKGAVDRAIARFLAVHEQEWVSEHPVPTERLPIKTMAQAFDAIDMSRR